MIFNFVYMTSNDSKPAQKPRVEETLQNCHSGADSEVAGPGFTLGQTCR